MDNSSENLGLPEGVQIPETGYVQAEPGAPLMATNPLSAPPNPYAPEYGADCCQGFDKHFGRAIAFVEITNSANQPMKIYWFMRATISSSIELRENTDSDSPVKQYQPTRREAITLDLESMVPEEGGRDFSLDLREGVRINNIRFAPAVSGGEAILDSSAATANWFLGSGPFFIERSNIDVSRDDWSTVRITIRGSGYDACEIEGTALEVNPPTLPAINVNAAV